MFEHSQGLQRLQESSGHLPKMKENKFELMIIVGAEYEKYLFIKCMKYCNHVQRQL
jgi:hypothetical protein